MDVAKVVTGAINEQQAVERLQSNPFLVEKLRHEVSLNMDQYVGMLSRLNEMEEKSRDKAREFIISQPRVEVVGRFSFIEFLSLVLVVIAAGCGGYVLSGPFSPDVKSLVVGAIIVQSLGLVGGFWFGSSLGSLRKDPAPKQVREP